MGLSSEVIQVMLWYFSTILKDLAIQMILNDSMECVLSPAFVGKQIENGRSQLV